MIKHIWFDFAGTLYRETSEFLDVHKQYRYKTYAEVAGLFDMNVAKSEYDKLYEQHGSNSAVFKHLGKPDNYWQKAVDSLDRTAFFPPDKDVIETLDTLHKAVPISIYTNFLRSKIIEMCNHLEIPLNYFTHILSGDDVSARKPQLDGFYKMIELSELSPNEIVYVGDREAVDIVPAKAVGMQACMLYGNSKSADYVFDSFKDLLSIV